MWERIKIRGIYKELFDIKILTLTWVWTPIQWSCSFTKKVKTKKHVLEDTVVKGPGSKLSPSLSLENGDWKLVTNKHKHH